MLRILTFDGRHYRLRLKQRPCPTIINRMVRSSRGTVTVVHKDGITSLMARDIRSVTFDDETLGAPWDYDDPLN